MTTTSSLQDFVGAAAYPGRGLAVGLDVLGEPLGVYWITGRSMASRSRTLVCSPEGASVVPTVAAEPDELRHYRAVKLLVDGIMIGNGSHVEFLADAISAGRSFTDAFLELESEPDRPIFTPRIAGWLTADHVAVGSARKSDINDRPEHVLMHADPSPGHALALTTYQSDGHTIAIDADPRCVSIAGDGAATLATVWHSLAPEFAVLVVVWSRGTIKYISATSLDR